MKQFISSVVLILAFGLWSVGDAQTSQTNGPSNAQELAKMQIALSAMQSENSQLLGRVESLEFLLSQSREEVNQMQGDDKALLEMIEGLRAQNQQVLIRLQTLEQANRANTAVPQASSPLASPVVPASSGNFETPTTTQNSAETSRLRPQGPNGTSASQVPSSQYTPPSSTQNVTRSGVTTTSTRTTSSRADPSAATNTVGTSVQPSSQTQTRQSAPTRTITYTTNNSSVGATTPPTTYGSAPRQTGSLGTIPASALPGEAGPLFADAKSKLLRFDYAGAESSFRQFLTLFADDPQAGEARYWLAESLHQQKAYVESGRAYSELLKASPRDGRAPDALVKLARSMRLIEAPEKACAALAALPKRYPNASPMVKAMADVESTRSNCN